MSTITLTPISMITTTSEDTKKIIIIWQNISTLGGENNVEQCWISYMHETVGTFGRFVMIMTDMTKLCEIFHC